MGRTRSNSKSDMEYKALAMELITYLQDEFDMPFKDARKASLYVLDLKGVEASKDHLEDFVQGNGHLQQKNKV